MLRALEIRDILIIDRLALAFRPGLNALTGETGAGKSILLDCLGFVLGWRGRADVLRPGAEAGEVTAVFDLPADHPVRELLADAGFPAGDELVLRRTIGADGRRGAWVNDRRATAELLRDISDLLVELHGQNDDRGLVNARGHRRLLDDFAGIDTAPCRAAWAALSASRRALAEAEADAARLEADAEWLRHAVDEFDRLAPRAGEEADLDARRRLQQAGARIRDDVARAAQALGPQGAEGLLGDAARWLAAAAGRAEGLLEPAIAALERAVTELGETTQEVERSLEALDLDPGELERVEERLFALRALARKHGVAPADLEELGADLHARLAALDGSGAGLKALRTAAAAADTAWSAAAASLGAARAAAALALDRAVANELAPLKLDRARFETRLADAEPGPEGRDGVEFFVATNPGTPAGPLNRIASGGELSRFLLALKVCLAKGGNAVTSIFDEIDRGVGGATADAVGRRLARLSEGTQVIVVTHSPQVAARAASHWRVEKRVEGERTTSAVVLLDEAARIDEVARMLAGETVTDAARAAARALVAG